MIRSILAVTAVLLLAACGADGAPERPTKGVGVSGEARIGVVLN
ncbi:MAG: hypothetical protein ACK4MS_01075 [Paracoccaceae bacterium]